MKKPLTRSAFSDMKNETKDKDSCKVYLNATFTTKKYPEKGEWFLLFYTQQ